MHNKKISFRQLPLIKIGWMIALVIFSAQVKALPPISPFITTWQTDGNRLIQIPLTGGGYDFEINWGDGTIETKSGNPGNISHTYASAGIYSVSITPNTLTGFPAIYINNFSHRNNLKTIAQWGGGQWATMNRAFFGAATMDVTATDIPDLSLVKTFEYMFLNCTALGNLNGSLANWVINSNPAVSINLMSMFQGATSFNQNLSSWEVSRVTNMGSVFNSATSFNQDIGSWDVSSVINMSSLFNNATSFNQDISNWKVSAVSNMSSMFSNARAFNQNIGGWNVSNVTTMAAMFQNAFAFNQNISVWDVSGVTDMNSMFFEARAFNQPLSGWGAKTGKVTNMANMLRQAYVFNQDIDSWDVSKVTNTNLMFYQANKFNQDLNSWNVTSLVNPSQMFQNAAAFNGNISNWTFPTDPTKSVNMSSMFQNAPVFNSDITGWDVSRVTNMGSMFNGARAFKQNISALNVSNVTTMAAMFQNAILFNQDISGWDVSKVTDMNSMFSGAVIFNQPLNGWGNKTRNVTNMVRMFQQAYVFDQDIDNWDVSKVTNTNLMFYQANKFNQDLNSWNVTNLINPYQMFQNAAAFNGNISNWTFPTDPTKSVNMSSMFQSAPAFNRDITGWDVSRVTNMGSMFSGASVFNQDISSWDVSAVTNMAAMFANTNAFNQDIGSWNTSAVTNMSLMFNGAKTFNQNISALNVSNVTTMAAIFQNAVSFNQDISAWDVSKVTDMNSMFLGAGVFDQPLNGWGAKTGNVTNMAGMFRHAFVFNQDIDSWDVSKVKNTNLMFHQANNFNQDLNSWNVSELVNPSQMFQNALAFNGNISSWTFSTDPAKSVNMTNMFYNASSFNQDISGWNMVRVTNINSMFQSATSFNKNISDWDISNITNAVNFLNGAKLSRANYDSLLQGWSRLDQGETKIPANLTIHFGTSKYSNVSEVVGARSLLTGTKTWTITDGGTENDFTPPVITGSVLALNDSTLSVTLSERAYSTERGSGNLKVTDFSFSMTGGSAVLSSSTPISISSTDNLTFTLGIGLTGIPNGEEMIIVNPVINSIHDLAGNAATVSQSDNTAQLYDLSFAVITGPGSATGDSSILSLPENRDTIFSFTADKPVTWSLGSAADESLFIIDALGLVTFKNAPDYETPLSTNNDNNYFIDVIATDIVGHITIQTLTITVTDVLPPTLSGFNSITKTTFDAPFILKAPVSNSTGTITYKSSNPAVAIISGSTITINGVGVAIITALQNPDATYDLDSISATLTVNQVSVLTKHGKVIHSSAENVNIHGEIGGSSGVTVYGENKNTLSGNDGLTPATASASAYAIKQAYPSSADGYYWIKNPNINSDTPFKIYADMTTDGGGWTLIMCNASNGGWNHANAISLNTSSPSINSNYSIIGWADYIKKSESDFQYMIDANTRNSYGGIWTANEAYTFTKGNNSQTNISLDIKFGTWTYHDAGIEKRMPWYSNCSGFITTSVLCGGGSWWGTLISQSGWTPAPWISNGCGTAGCMPNPGKIWYWVR